MMKKFIDFIKRPHWLFLIILYIVTLLFLFASVAIMALDMSSTAYGIVVFILSGLCFFFTIWTLIYSVPRAKKYIIEGLKHNKYTGRLLGNYSNKVIFFAFVSFLINLAFVIINLVAAIQYLSIFYGFMTAYYFGIMLLFGGVLVAEYLSYRKNKEDQSSLIRSRTKIYFYSGIAMFIMCFIIIGTVSEVIVGERIIETGEIMAIATAAYTFYRIVTSIIDLKKAYKQSDPIVKSINWINICVVLVSLMSLQATMISVFGSNEGIMFQMNTIMGLIVCSLILLISVFMIVNGALKLRKLSKEKEEKEKDNVENS